MKTNTITLELNGSLELTIYHLNGNNVSEKLKDEVLEKLRASEYLLGLSTKTICSINNLGVSLYDFDFDTLSDTEYTFF